MTDDDDGKIIIFDVDRQIDAPERTIVDNNRRYGSDKCKHKGPFNVDDKLQYVECGDCGSYLSPMYVLGRLASREAYWTKRREELQAHLVELNAEIEGRQRTKCTHCGNMTAIRFKSKMPQTWVGEL